MIEAFHGLGIFGYGLESSWSDSVIRRCASEDWYAGALTAAYSSSTGLHPHAASNR